MKVCELVSIINRIDILIDKHDHGQLNASHFDDLVKIIEMYKDELLKKDVK